MRVRLLAYFFLLASVSFLGLHCAPPCDKTECGAQCIDTQKDRRNCGSCGNACPAGQNCNNGKCTGGVCQAPQTDCAGSCVDTQSDPKNCGGCGLACKSGESCNNGQCTGGVVCNSGQTDCGGTCVDTASDNSHCGSCNNACPSGQTCQGAQCKASACQAPQTDCGGSCVDTSSDNGHCGSCNNACPSGQTCKSGTCEAGQSCQAPKTACAGACVDTQSNNLHCGQCNNPCPNGQTCQSGKCEAQANCQAPQTDCGGTCYDLQTAFLHCGKCGNSCTSSQKCIQGKCVLQCQANEKVCGNTCADLQRDPLHCGACGTTCKQDENCVSGVCAGKCPQGQAVCNGNCTHILNDPRNCGSCGNVCPSGQNCTQGKCASSGCFTNADCASKPQTPKCDSATGLCVQCLVDADCSSGQICNLSGTCQTGSGGSKDVGDVCTSATSCKSGLRCLGVDQTTSVCFEPCTQDSDCKDTFRNACVTAGTNIQLCLRRSKKGEVCGFTTSKQGLCESGQNPPLYCDNTKKTCESSQLQKKVGDACNKQNDTTQPPKVCDVSLGLACSETTGKCVKAQQAKEGEECDPTGSNTGSSIVCATGLSCIRFDQAGTLLRCHKLCSQNSECTVTGTKCEKILTNGGGLCFDTTCSKDSDCAFKNYTCSSNSSGNICLPKQASGNTAYGAVCKSSPATSRCNTDASNGGHADNFCLTVQGKSSGFCSRDCTTSGTCPDWKSGSTTLKATCIDINMTTKACVFPCGQPGQKCPTGLTCQNVGQQLCLAP